MKKIALGLLAAALAAAVAGCSQHTYIVGAGAPEGEVVYKHWHHHWLFGLIRPERQKELHLDEFCPSGNATVHQEVSFVNGLIDILTGLIYLPTTVEIRCDDGKAAQVVLEEQEVAEIVSDARFLDLVLEVAPERLVETRTAFASFERATAGRSSTSKRATAPEAAALR